MNMKDVYKKLALLRKQEMILISGVEKAFEKLIPANYPDTMTLEELDEFEADLHKKMSSAWVKLFPGESHSLANRVGTNLYLMRKSIKLRIKWEKEEDGHEMHCNVLHIHAETDECDCKLSKKAPDGESYTSGPN